MFWRRWKQYCKTLGSLEIALESNKYVADEFCFFDVSSRVVFGYKFIPIHIRPDVEKHLQSQHDLTLPETEYEETKAGHFINPSRLFQLESGKLDALSYIHFTDAGKFIEKLSQEKAWRSFKICITSHIAKLLHPELDRMQFVSTTDTSALKIINEEMADEILARLAGRQFGSEILNGFPSYALAVSQPCQIVPLLREEIS